MIFSHQNTTRNAIKTSLKIGITHVYISINRKGFWNETTITSHNQIKTRYYIVCYLFVRIIFSLIWPWNEHFYFEDEVESLK